MTDLCRLLWCALIGLFRSRAALEGEILVLRHQLSVLRRKAPTRLSFSNIDCLVFAGLYRLDSWGARRSENRQAGDGNPLASRRLPSLRSLRGYDEPEILPSSTHQICLMSADGGQLEG